MRILEVLKEARKKWVQEGEDPIELIDKSGLLITKSYYWDGDTWRWDCVEIFDPRTKDVIEIYDEGQARLNGEWKDLKEIRDLLEHIFREAFWP